MLKYVTDYVESKRKNGEFDDYDIDENKELNTIVVNIKRNQPLLKKSVHISVDELECLSSKLIKPYLDKLFKNE